MDDERLPVFVCHAAADAPLLHEMEQHLAPLSRSIDIWHRGRCSVGTEPAREASERLARANLILHVVSANYLASDLCYNEAEQAIEREKGGVTNIAILVRACLWKSAMNVPAVVLPSNWMPVTSWSNRDEAWTSVAEGVRSAVLLLNGAAQIVSKLRENMVRAGASTSEVASAIDAFEARAAFPKSQNDPVASPSGENAVRMHTSGIPESIGSVAELIRILEDRAASIKSDLQAHYSYAAVQEYLAEFEELHSAHLESLREGQMMRAHELARRIHRLSWRLEADDYWRRHQLEAPNVRYRLAQDAFSRGPMALTYLPELKVLQSPYSSITQPTSTEAYLGALGEMRSAK